MSWKMGEEGKGKEGRKGGEEGGEGWVRLLAGWGQECQASFFSTPATTHYLRPLLGQFMRHVVILTLFAFLTVNANPGVSVSNVFPVSDKWSRNSYTAKESARENPRKGTVWVWLREREREDTMGHKTTHTHCP